MKIGCYVVFFVLILLLGSWELLLIFFLGVLANVFIAIPLDKKHRNCMRDKFKEQAAGDEAEYIRLCNKAMIKYEYE